MCVLDNFMTAELRYRITTAFKRQEYPFGEKCKCGSEAKEVEFLRSLLSVCLTFLLGPAYTFSSELSLETSAGKIQHPSYKFNR